MRVLIDADGCPVVDIAIRIAKAQGAECMIFCDAAHEFERDGVAVVTVPIGADSVDFKLVNMLSKGDIVITQDYGLAAMCLARGAVPISQNGVTYNNDNIDALLAQRHFARKMRAAGMHMSGNAKRAPHQDKAFAKTLLAVLRQE